MLAWKDDKKRLPLIVYGARQTGKTYLIKNFAADHFDAVHIFNFESDPHLADFFSGNLEPKDILHRLGVYQNRPIQPDQDLIFFDEIQACPEALTSLKYFNEHLPQLAVIAAGSLLGLSLSPGSFPVGKVDFLHMHPMTFGEFLAASGETQLSQYRKSISRDDHIPEGLHQRLWEQFRQYLIVGGLPEAVLAWRAHDTALHERYERVRNIQQSLQKSYLADMAKHAGKQNSMHLERLWLNVVEQLGRHLDGHAKKFVFKNVLPGKKGYDQLAGTIDWLEKAGLVMKVLIAGLAQTPIAGFTKQNTFKLYLFDCGLLGAMAGIAPRIIQEYSFGMYKGFFVENFVAGELAALQDSRLFSWQENQSELEFLLERDGKILPVEVKSSTTLRATSLRIFQEKYHPEHAVILSGRNLSFDKKYNTHCIPLYLTDRLQEMLGNV